MIESTLNPNKLAKNCMMMQNWVSCAEKSNQLEKQTNLIIFYKKLYKLIKKLSNSFKTKSFN